MNVPLARTIATDGAGSVVRTGLAAEGLISAREELLDHDYKELTLPPVNGKPVLDVHALHVWPRGGFMLIALPNTDGSFTATLFLSRKQFAELVHARGGERVLRARVSRRRAADPGPARRSSSRTRRGSSAPSTRRRGTCAIRCC